MKIKPHLRQIILLLMVIVLLVGTGGAARSFASQATPGALTDPVVVRLYVTDVDNLNAVAGELDIWESHPEALYVVALVKPETYEWLKNLGYRMEIDEEKTALIQNPEAVLDPRYHYFDDNNPNSLDNYIVDFMETVNLGYPDLIEMIDIGDAWEGLHGGYNRDIWVMRITNEDPAYGPIEDKPVFYLHGGIHAREVVIPELLIRYISYLTSGYNGLGGYDVDPDVTWLVNHNVAYVLITTNPDGHIKNELNEDAWWRKNTDSDDGCSVADWVGVDLNRNFPFMWGCCGGSSGDPCDDTYRGPSAGSEPENDTFMTHLMSVIPDQNGPNGNTELPEAAPDDTTGILLSMHSYSNLTLSPWGATSLPEPANQAQLTTLARKFATYTGYTTFSIWYDTDGGTVDWGYGKLGIPAYTFEVGPQDGICGSFFPAYECIDGATGYPENFWAENRPAFIYAHKVADTPYMTSYGPDAQNLAVSPDPVFMGMPANLTAIIKDNRCCGSPVNPVSDAEYFIDAPGANGTGFAMEPVDGAWGETTEDASATVDTSSLAPGKHYILVHGLNDDGLWGPYTAIFLTVEEPTAPVASFTYTPEVVHLDDTVQFTDTSFGAQPLEYLWDFGDGTATSTEQNPAHQYTGLGEFAVVQTVSNTFGVDVFTGTINVLPVDVLGVDLTLETTGTLETGQEISFLSLITPTEATPPFNYSVDFGDGTEIITGTTGLTELPFAHTYSAAGTFTVTVEVWNTGAPVSDTIEVVITSSGYKLYLPGVTK